MTAPCASVNTPLRFPVQRDMRINSTVNHRISI